MVSKHLWTTASTKPTRLSHCFKIKHRERFLASTMRLMEPQSSSQILSFTITCPSNINVLLPLLHSRPTNVYSSLILGSTIGNLGTAVAPHYQPHTLLSNPPSPSSITLELLLASQSHLGHSTSLWNPMNSRYIFGIRNGIHIISLDVTASHLRRACRVVSGVAERGGLILFVGTRKGHERCVVNAAKLAGGCHLFEWWIPGTITNGQQLLSRCRMKVVDEFDRKLDGYEDKLRDQPVLKPDLVVCLNPLENWVLLHECGVNNIPTIGIIDTDANPTWVTYPIPANDDSLRCVQTIAGVLGRAGEEGQQLRLEKAKKGQISYNPASFGTPGRTRNAKLGGSGADVHAGSNR